MFPDSPIFVLPRYLQTLTLKYFNTISYLLRTDCDVHPPFIIQYVLQRAPAQDGDVPDLATRCLYIRSTFTSDCAVGLEAMGPMEHEEMTEVVF